MQTPKPHFIDFEYFEIKIADTWLSRLRGLLGSEPLHHHQALWLRPCHSVHTFGMSYPIAVHFLDKNMRIIKSLPCLKPNRVAICLKAYSVLEMRSVSAIELTLQIKAIEEVMQEYSQAAG